LLLLEVWVEIPLETADFETLHELIHGSLELTATILPNRLLQHTFLVDFWGGFFEIHTQFVAEGFLGFCSVTALLWHGAKLPLIPEVRVQTASHGLKATVKLVVIGHEDVWHLLLVIVTVENPGSRRHGALSIFAGEILRHDNFLVVRSVRAGIGWAAEFVNRAALRSTSHHECSGQSLGAFVNILVCHLTDRFTIQGLDQPEEISLEALRVGFLHSFTTLFHAICLQFVVLLDDKRMFLLHFLINLGK